MNTLTLQAAFAGLLYDLNKLPVRAGCAPTDLLSALPNTADWAAVRACTAAGSTANAALCVQFARSCSAIVAAPENEPAETRLLPLRPVFSHLNGEHLGFSVPAFALDSTLHFPTTGDTLLSASFYQETVRELSAQLPQLVFAPESINALLGLLEHRCGALPASTTDAENRDISLYDHLRLTSALAACVSEFVQVSSSNRALLKNTTMLRQANAFLLYSADFSHIQKFIYTVRTDGALRALRSRSFFLDLLMEHYLDELLDACGLSRVHVIYSGGGHCYLLLPNTSLVQQSLTDWNHRFNCWLQEQFGVQLFLANGWELCSADTLCNCPAEQSPYKALFQRVNALADQHKQHPCTAADLLALNRSVKDTDGTRECRICGISSNLDSNDRCPWCRLFAQLSGQIQSQQPVFLVSCSWQPDSFRLPGADGTARFVSLISPADAAACKDRVRCYTKNKAFDGLSDAVNLYIGDYAASNDMAELSEQAQGIRRIAICRMDVDNLGQAFISGFECPDETNPVQKMRYVNLSRAAAFSRQMSLFFKYFINGLLEGLSVSIVYAGGDDVFLVGAWNDTLEAAQRIQCNLTQYTCGTLTISAGIGLFHDHFPIRSAAAMTALLEDTAKDLPGKNAVALFDAVPDYTYSWDALRKKVLGEKLTCLNSFFSLFKNQADDERHNISMLYNLLTLLCATKDDRINFARCAYLLTRLAPSSEDKEKQLIYQEFSHNIIDWAQNEEQRRQLITAIYIYIYQNRGRD